MTRIDLPHFRAVLPAGFRPTWELALFYPGQGSWTREEYFGLESHFGRGFRAELVDGELEVLPGPTEEHQDIALYLYEILKAWVKRHDLGKVSFSGIRVLVANGDNPKFRQPDVVFMKKENSRRRLNEYWEGADMAVEVVSDDPKDLARDYETKAAEYAAAGIAEYWIVDPMKRQVRVLTLEGECYRPHGDFGAGETARSVLLPGFEAAVDEVLAGGERG